jgi:hypothetical protein
MSMSLHLNDVLFFLQKMRACASPSSIITHFFTGDCEHSSPMIIFLSPRLHHHHDGGNWLLRASQSHSRCCPDLLRLSKPTPPRSTMTIVVAPSILVPPSPHASQRFEKNFRSLMSSSHLSSALSEATPCPPRIESRSKPLPRGVATWSCGPKIRTLSPSTHAFTT